MTNGWMRNAAGLLALAFSGALALDGAASYLVSGIVVDSRSRSPLGNVRVSLAPTSARAQKLEQFTKRDGRFSFAVSEPGKYSLSMTKPGYPLQDYKQAGFAGVSSAIVVRDDQDTSRLVFEARLGSAITGLVKDEDSEPVGNALVTIFQSAIVEGDRRIIFRGQTRANAFGEFRLSGLPRGNYYVCAMGRPWFADPIIQLQEMQGHGTQFHHAKAVPIDGESAEPVPAAPKFSPDPVFRGTAFRTTFYPNAQSVDQASLLRLEAGSETQISITLPLTSAVSVKAAINDPRELGDGRAFLYKRVYDHSVSFLEEWVRRDKTFQFGNVPPGSYEIVAVSQAGAGASSWNIHERVEVGASDMEVTLRAQQMSSLAGRVLFEGERPAAQPDLFVALRNEKGGLVGAEVNTEGSFSLSRVPAGQYEVTGGNADYMAAYLTGPDSERLPLSLTIPSGETIHRDLTLTRAVSTIDGTVENSGWPQIGAFVVLIPKDSAHRWGYRVDQTDSDGSYHLGTIPSGDYSLIALSDGEDVAYRDAKVGARLREAAKAVRVEAGDHLELKLDLVGTATLKLPPL